MAVVVLVSERTCVPEQDDFVMQQSRRQRIVTARYICVALVFVSLSLPACGDAVTDVEPTGDATILTDDGRAAAVSGRWVVWEGRGEIAPLVIVVRDLVTGEDSVLSRPDLDAEFPAVGAGYAVWTESDPFVSGSVQHIAVADLKNNRRLIGFEDAPPNANFRDVLPDVGEGLVVWERRTAVGTDLWSLSLNTGEINQLTDTPDALEQGARVSASHVVWFSLEFDPTTRDFLGTRIVVLDRSTGITTPFTELPGGAAWPAVSGTRAVWRGFTLGDTQPELALELGDLVTGARRRLPGTLLSEDPDIEGRWIAWHAEIGGNTDVFLYDIETDREFRVTSGPNVERNAALSDSLLVWEEINPNGFHVFAIPLPQ